MLTIYKASAGSGKTFTLTLEYIKMLLGSKNEETGQYTLIVNRDKPQRHILAITFTNKATDEMKHRIILELSILAASPDKSNYIGALCEIFHTDDTGAISLAAKNALYSILFNFSNFNVSTIDSFFQQVLRTFAYEIDRNGGFEIELDRRALISQAIIQLFSTLDDDVAIVGPEQKLLRHWLEKFMDDKVENSKRFNVFNRDSSLFSSLVKSMDEMMDETFSLNSRAMTDYLDDPEKLRAFERAISKYVKKLKGEIATKATMFLDNIISLNIERFSKMKPEWLRTWIKGNIAELKTTVVNASNDKEKVFSVKSKGESAPAIADSLKQMGSDLAALYVKNYRDLVTLGIMRDNIYLMGLLGLVIKAMRDYCREKNVIMLSDTNELINGIIGNSPTPFIYERMGLKLRHYLIDEFQDTSKMQWLNLTPLMVESLSKDNDNLIIGDEKQSIYRFRNAAPELLGHEAADNIASRRMEVSTRGLILEENRNWRSVEEVIKFNNSLFYALGCSGYLPEDNAYKNVIQDISPKSEGTHGKVTFHFLDSSTNPQFQEEATPLAVNTIAELLKVYRPGEIAILIRKNNEGPEIINALLKAMEPGEDGTPPLLPRFNIISNEAVTLTSSPAIKLLVNILKLIDRPANYEDEASGEATGKKYTKADSLRLHHRFELNLTEATSAGEALASAVENPGDPSSLNVSLTDKSGTNDLISMIDRAILTLPEKMRVENTLFITTFQDIVRDYISRNQGDLYSFLKWWDSNGDGFKIDSPESPDAMTISTIHKSKGIEYPCVVIPYAGKTPRTGADRLYWLPSVSAAELPDEAEIAPEIIPPMFPTTYTSRLSESPFAADYAEQQMRNRIDTLNTYYVAFTRAKKEMIVIAMKKGESEMKEIYNCMTSLTSERLESIMNDSDEKMRRLVVPLADMINEESGLFEYGDRVAGSKSSVKIDTGCQMPSYTVFDNSDKLRLVTVEKEDEDPENARQTGTFMHEVLRGVYSVDDIAYRCRQEGQKAGLDEKAVNERIGILEQALTDSQARRWFENCRRVVMERNITVSGKHELRRPDRIVWTDDGHIDVVDFKFGEKHLEKYKGQVQQYVDLLRESGLKNVRGYIWYPLEKQVIEVDDGIRLSLF